MLIAQKDVDISFINYGENIAYLIHTCKCNLNCSYCYNKIRLSKIKGNNHEDYLKLLKKDHEQNNEINHLVLTGGEPLYEKDISDLIKILCKDFKIKLDTNGTFPDRLLNVIYLLDFIALDIKWNITKEHERGKELIGIPIDYELNKKILKTLKILFISKNFLAFDFELRTTLCKPYFESFDSFISTVKYVDKLMSDYTSIKKKINWYIQIPNLFNIVNMNINHIYLTGKIPKFKHINLLIR